VWEFKLEEDNMGQECTCFGLAIKPVTRSNYDLSRELWMYRCVAVLTMAQATPTRD
jgi:hypothetical protein